jgi:hypothetical protein
MESFNIIGTELVPTIDMNPETGDFKIKGRLISISGKEYQYFKPLIDWVNNYALNPAPNTFLDIDLEYCSSGGTKFLFQLFRILEKIHGINTQIEVVWHYYTDDDDSLEKGYQFQKLLSLPFQVKQH